ncbi:type II secretion system protein [Bacillus sp. ISL-37]|jgi:type IV pilus assembly protein PilA|uniref:type IV pilin protein n=1 Tax=Bacillus sp. ISL-37 TaxID=2819123 RepID=UPI001BE8E187|nr:type II secretion system protein [Bacillus sp. ISL-37]MBT2684570.1 type II secretion system protein [Bacillus sp. ISL-37]
MLKAIKKKLKDQRGLTLVELLAVIVILGIIAAIAVPSIGNIIDKSKEDAIKADARMILNAAKLYKIENDIPDTGIGSTQLEPAYLDGLQTFSDSTADDGVVTPGYTVTVNSDGKLELDGKGTKDNISITFTGTTLEEIDGLSKD